MHESTVTRRTSRSHKLFAMLAIAGSLSLTAQAQAETTVHAVMHAALRALDPVASSATIARNYGYMVYDTLIGLDGNNQLQPQMADWTVSDDGLSYTFTLRDGLLWHDGTPVTSRDCVASLKRWGVFDTGGKLLMANVDSLQAVNDKQFVLKLARPFGDVLELIAKPSSVAPFIMPEQVASAAPGEPLANHIGSGPFRFVDAEFQPGVKAVFEKFADYQPRSEAPSGTAGSKQVYVDRVEWINMPDMQTTVNAINSGDIDYIERTPFDLLPLLEGNPEITSEVLDKLGMQTLGRMNFLQPPFDDLRIRRAALLAIKQKDVLAALVGDPRYYQLCGSVFGCNTAQSSEVGAETLIKDGDLGEAQRLLKEAGYQNTPVVILQPSDVGTLAPQPMVVAQQLRKAGFNVELKQMDWQTLVSQRASKKSPAEGGWNMMFTNFAVDSIWSPAVNPTLIATGNDDAWFGWPKDERMEQLRSEFSLSTDPAQRKSLSAAVQKEAMDQVIVVPLGQFQNVTSWRNELSDIVQGTVTAFWGMKKAD
ncbi:peptide/nickel transport system substrate-binding protein [Pseudomonas cuatrocienegasensis]|uniref:Peptide/nickel transport system substrate-binding protein n=1 Tax=Pseudomonas cuatrocienegasensis TaxID=543360 RepID=A0ABY1BP71_9PSED|nr:MULTISPECIES: ABC transporter substrate-binding protein [Pseudomonas]OEC34130.1 ABC transporter substrate-binding protein [Pseudomonas sp. 21C1]SER29787.1 peptide/nickel transport system substrate-binding protein [Pseudomonas cuatrocienegasensis]